MFKGKHSIEYKPLTIFTGANNSGKSTLMSLTAGMITQYGEYITKVCPYLKSLYPLSENSSGTLNKLGIEDSDEFLEIYYLQNLFLDDTISSFANVVDEKPSHISFYDKDNPIIKFDPRISSYGEDDFFTTISIDFGMLYTLYSSKKPNSENQRSIIRFLEMVRENGFPVEIFQTELVDTNTPLPLFERDSEKNPYVLKVRVYESEYYHITRTNTNDFLFFYCNIIYSSIRENKDIREVHSSLFLKCVKFALKDFFLHPLKIHTDNFNNLVQLSAYRGKFVSETGSQASEILSKVINIENELIRENILEGIFRRGEPDKSKIKFLEKWTIEFGLGNKLNFEKTPINLLTISQSNKTSRYPFELGFGNQQFLPILLSICTKSKGLFLIEEPESHLHPCLQSKLADFFIDALSIEKNSQFIIETHSEYFIRKLQYLIAKGQIDKEMVALYYVHNAEKVPSGCSQIQRMEIRDDGIIKQEFGSGFFDESAHLAMDLLNLKKSN